MPNTPFFPAWRPCLAALGSRTAQALGQVRSVTLCKLESCLGSWVPIELFPKAAESQNSRDRHYTRWRTFWCMLWQSLNPDASGREVVRQLQALFRLEAGPSISEDDGGYCRAKARLPLTEFPKALAATAKAADQQAPPMTLLVRGRSPEMVQMELYARLIAHNLIRCIVAQAAAEHGVALERVSFKGSLDALRQFSQAMARARCKKSAGNCGPNCSTLWPPIWCRSGRADASRAR